MPEPKNHEYWTDLADSLEVKPPKRSIDFKNVERKHEILFVGDNNGSYRGLLKNLAKLECVQIIFVGDIATADELGDKTKTRPHTDITQNIEEYELDSREEVERFFRSTTISWTGDDKKLVLLGDILADRNSQGDLVLQALGLLQGQAKSCGGQVKVIAGNHDIFWLDTLFEGTSGNKIGIAHVSAPLEELDPYKIKEETKNIQGQNYTLKDFDQKKMLASPAIQRHLELFKALFDVAAVEDDTLIIHADVDEKEFMSMYKKTEQAFFEKNKFFPSVEEVITLWNTEFQSVVASSISFLQQFSETYSSKKESTLEELAGLEPFFEFFVDDGNVGNVLCGINPDKRTLVRNPGKYSATFEKFLSYRGINCLVVGHTSVINPTAHGEIIDIIPIDGMTDKLVPNKFYSAGKIGMSGEISLHHRDKTYTKRTP